MPDFPCIDDSLIHSLLSFSGQTTQAVAKDLRKANQIISVDVDMAVVRIRKALDIMIRSAAKKSGVEPGTKPLENLIVECRRAGILPDIIEKHCRMIKDFGNLAAHDINCSERVSQEEVLSLAEADLCFRSMDIIVNWYITRVLPELVQDHSLFLMQGRAIPPDLLVQTADIDALVYPQEFRGTPPVILSWFARNPDIYTILLDRGSQKVVGYINAMPLEDEYFNKMKSGNLLDVAIPAEAVRTYDLPDFYKLYFASIAIDPSYQGPHAFRLLYDGYLEKLLSLARNDIFISEILADAITKEGEKFIKFAGLNKFGDSSHGSALYQATLLPPALRVTTAKGKALMVYYQKKYQEFKEFF